MKIIYDIGSNNGDDIPYYLMKCDMVVAVEANTSLCKQIESKFTDEIASGRLVVENCVITDCEQPDNGDVNFYIHKENHVLSRFLQPNPEIIDDFTKVSLPAKTVTDLIKTHGDPFYIKIDVEHYDAQICRSLFSQDICPDYISVECHAADVLALLISNQNYSAYKLVDGGSLPDRYSDREIYRSIEKDKVKYSFPPHSAGPFGNDIDGPWLDASDLFRLLQKEGLGWKDVHASRIDAVDASAALEVPHDNFVRKANEIDIRNAALNQSGRFQFKLACCLTLEAAQRIIKKITRADPARRSQGGT